MSHASEQTIQHLLNTFLKPPSGKSPAAIRERLLYWIEQANHPEKYTKDEDTSKLAIADVRRKARQNVRRIIAEHPVVASSLAKEQSSPEVA